MFIYPRLERLSGPTNWITPSPIWKRLFIVARPTREQPNPKRDPGGYRDPFDEENVYATKL
jgi:hypothetical protein